MMEKNVSTQTGAIPVADAIHQLIQLAATQANLGQESLNLAEVGGRIAATDIIAPIPVPQHRNSAMDGYALCVDQISIGHAIPISQRIAAGLADPRNELHAGSAAQIFTGAALPIGADAVVMQEHVTRAEQHITLHELPRVGQHIREPGSDIQQGTTLIKAGDRISIAQMGLLASVGIASLNVNKPLRVALCLTGDELIEPGQTLPFGGVYNANRFLLKEVLQRLGCQVTDHAVLPDQFEVTRDALQNAAATHDVILTAGGVSVGGEDHVKNVIAQCGELSLWKIAIKPGKPMAVGRIGDCTILGLPGNPVSALITFLIVARPYLLARMGQSKLDVPTYVIQAAFNWTKTEHRSEYLRAKINPQGQVDIYPDQKSGVLSSCAWAEGLVALAPGQTVQAGDHVPYIPYSAFFD